MSKGENLGVVAAVVREVEAEKGKRVRSTPGAKRYNDSIISAIRRRLAELQRQPRADGGGGTNLVY